MPRRSDTFGARVRAAREAAGLTQSELARAVGLPRQRIWDFEHDAQGVPFHNILVPLAAALGVEPGELDARLKTTGAKP